MNTKTILKFILVPTLLLATAIATFIIGCSSTSSSSSSASGREQFSSPDAAVTALVKAVREQDKGRLKKMLAPVGEEIISSGDPVSDRADAERFLALYDEGHRFEPARDGGSTLLVGKDDWPFPVPIIKVGNKYEFDAEAGEDEILNRRIGRNELSTEQVCLAIVDAQRDYVAMNPTHSDLPLYARKIISDPGEKNGLYWPTTDGEPPSPMGPLVATAADEGYGKRATTQRAAAVDARPPYHGYRYKLLTAQGPHAEGGAADYIVNGKLIGGFGVIAYPAQYGNSGIMTFITNHDGVVYQRDLGPDSQTIAEAMTTFDPGPKWTKCAEASEPTTQPD
jgi:hypothetical protein